MIEIVAVAQSDASFFDAVLLCVSSLARSKVAFAYLRIVSLFDPANSTAI